MWNLTSYNNPFSQLRTLQKEMNDLFSDTPYERNSFPRVNIYDNGNEIRILAEMPGLTKDEIHINVLGNNLAIEAEKKEFSDCNEVQIHRKEIYSGKFIRSFNLPYEIDSEQVKANLKNGVLEICLTRAEQSKPRKISVSAE